MTVRGDIRRLEQVFFNLIDNALKFTPDGGRVAIDVRIADGNVEIQVKDTGAGMEPGFLPYVFDRFRQADSATSRTHGGLGLGLSIAKQLVEAHAGHITATSEGKGLGSTFIVQLPLSAMAEDSTREIAAAPALNAASVEPRLIGLCVLVVDDEPDAREIMATALEASGARVEVAGSARDAFEILERTPIDVLLSDIAMPDEDGFALIRGARVAGTRPAAGHRLHRPDGARRRRLPSREPLQPAIPSAPSSGTSHPVLPPSDACAHGRSPWSARETLQPVCRDAGPSLRRPGNCASEALNLFGLGRPSGGPLMSPGVGWRGSVFGGARHAGLRARGLISRARWRWRAVPRAHGAAHQNNGEPSVLFCFIYLYMAAHGAGEWSLDAILRRKDGRRR